MDELRRVAASTKTMMEGLLVSVIYLLMKRRLIRMASTDHIPIHSANRIGSPPYVRNTKFDAALEYNIMYIPVAVAACG